MMKKKIRIIIGVLVSIPICLVIYTGLFLSSCMNDYKHWLIDYTAKREEPWKCEHCGYESNHPLAKKAHTCNVEDLS